MENLSYVSLSQQVALFHQMEVTANNIANMNTPGFKSEGILFKEYVNQAGKTPARGGNTISQVEDYATYRNLLQGPMTQTGNKLDAAIGAAEGYFAIETPEGTRYTRDGGFSLNAQRELVTKSGFRVMSSSGSPVKLQEDARDITIMGDGSVSSEQGDIGKLKIVKFDNQQKLLPVGGNLFDAQGAAEQPLEHPDVAQGALEGSNVQPVMEMNNMIQLQRMFEAAQRIIMNDHDMQRSMIRKLTEA